MKKKLIIVAIGLLAIAAGCPEESEKLLNPESFSETVGVRLANFTDQPLELQLSLETTEEMISTGEVGSLDISKGLVPPSDSSIVSIRSGNDILFDTNAYYKFSRDFNYLFMALPKANSNYAFDTIIDFTDLGDGNLDEINASVKIFNAIPDSNLTINIQLGCPGGETFNSTPLPYKELSFSEAMRADDEISLSLIGYDGFGETLQLGTYVFEFEQGGEYTLVPYLDKTGEYIIYVINESNLEIEMLEQMTPIEEKLTEIRLINLTENPLTIARNGDQIIPEINADLISDYYNVPACGSLSSETFTLSSNTMNFLYNPDVNLRYTAIAYTSEFTGLDTLIFVAPPIIDVIRDGRALIRAVNVTNPETGLTISNGANSSSQDPDEENTRGFTSGSSISRGLLYGEISEELFILPGVKPIIIFTSDEPSKYLSSAVIELEADKNYFIFGNSMANDYQFYLIEEDQGAGMLEPLGEGVLTGIVNAFSQRQELSYTLDNGASNILTGAKVIYEDAITTVIPPGQNDISYDGISESWDAEAGKRNLIITTGLNNPETFILQDDPMIQEDLNFKWRFINAAPNNQFITIYLTDGADDQGQSLIQGLEYKDVSLTSAVEEVSTYGLIYVDNTSGDTLYNAENLPITRGKGYSIIFAGTEGSYSVIIQQEF